MPTNPPSVFRNVRSVSTPNTPTHPAWLACFSTFQSFGLSVADFNTLSRRIGEDPELKTRVLNQAYLYRVLAEVNEKSIFDVVPEGVRGNEPPPAPILAIPMEPLQAEGRGNGGSARGAGRPRAVYTKPDPVNVEVFAVASNSIERLRQNHEDELRRELDIKVRWLWWRRECDRCAVFTHARTHSPQGLCCFHTGAPRQRLQPGVPPSA